MVILAASISIASAFAQDPDDQKRGVARLSFVEGDVSVQRGDSGDWVAATVNAPILTNDRIATGPNARAEVQFDAINVLRLSGTSEITMTQLEDARSQMGVNRGTVTFRVLRTSNADLEVDTPSISVRPSKMGAYRIAVMDSGETEVTARSGEVEVFSPTGSQWVRPGQKLMARGPASDPEFQVVRAAANDEWDRWSDSRDQAVSRSRSAQYVGPGVYGAEDLDPYGNWVDVPGYGYAWHPVAVDGWAPYRQGRWVWVDWYGWTWVSYEPWGWAPYHYGRWFYEPAYGWCWYPGAIGVRHYWAPALVAFFGFGGGGVSVGFGFGNVGWVPLAPYEVLHPWWGRGYYGGPTYVNRSINITSVNVTNVYRNARVTNGVTAVSEGDFRAGRFNGFVRPTSEQIRQAGVVRGPMPIAPDRAHLQFSERQPAFVPRSGANTRFFTREQPNPAPRVSFTEQRRALDPGGRPAAEVQNPRGQSAVPAWQRFGNSRGAQQPQQPQQAESSPPPPANRSWNRFGNAGAAPRPEARQTPQREPRNQSQPEFRRGPSNGAPPQRSGGGSRAPAGGSPRSGGNREGSHNR
jgi:hypothetical protein